LSQRKKNSAASFSDSSRRTTRFDVRSRRISLSADAVAAMTVGVDADQAVDTLGDLLDEKAIVGRIS